MSKRSKQPAPEPVEYTAWIVYQAPGVAYQSAAGAGTNDRDETMREMTYLAHYYAKMDGYEICEITMSGVCPECKGDGGYRTGKRVRRWHTCPVCSGEGLLWTLPMEPAAVLALPDPGSRHSL